MTRDVDTYCKGCINCRPTDTDRENDCEHYWSVAMCMFGYCGKRKYENEEEA